MQTNWTVCWPAHVRQQSITEQKFLFLESDHVLLPFEWRSTFSTHTHTHACKRSSSVTEPMTETSLQNVHDPIDSFGLFPSSAGMTRHNQPLVTHTHTNIQESKYRKKRAISGAFDSTAWSSSHAAIRIRVSLFVLISLRYRQCYFDCL